jgi:tRNA modification GTPase
MPERVVGIIRISGKQALAIAEQVCCKTLVPRQAIFTQFHDVSCISRVIDEGIAIYFKAPHSFPKSPSTESNQAIRRLQ